jgi:hypothetical protein
MAHSTMRDFDVYLMDPTDRIISREVVVADHLGDAVSIGFDRFLQHKGTGLQSVVRIEIWSGTERLFVGQRERHHPLSPGNAT